MTQRQPTFWESTKSRSVKYWVALAIFAWFVPGWVIWIPAALLVAHAMDKRIAARRSSR